MIWPKVVDKGVCREGGGIFFSSPTAVLLIVPTRSSSHISGQSSSRDFMIGKKLEASSQKRFCDGLPALVLNAIVEHRWCQLMLVSKQHLQNSQANKKERRQLARLPTVC